MKIVLLTRTSRPSGALVAESLIKNKKDLVAIIAEERSELLKKKGGGVFILADSLKKHGFQFTKDRLFEALRIKLHYFLRKTLSSKIYHSKIYLSIEELILDNRIPYFLVKDHNSQETEELIRKFSPDIIIITNTRLIRKNILSIPKSGCLNLHLSLLPKYAGLDSIFWALFHAEAEIGVTVHFVAEELDRGDIVLQKKIAVAKDDDEKTLYLKAVKLGAQMVAEAVTHLEWKIVTPIKQDQRIASYFSWPTKEQRRLLRRKLRGRHKIKEERPLKVLHIITRLIKGGAQENTLLTVLGLREKGYDVMLLSGPSEGPEGEIESYARAMAVNLAIIPELVRPIDPWKDLVSLVKIFYFIKGHRFDIVHTHTSKAGIIGRLAAKFAGVPVIVHTPHGHIFHSYFRPLKTWLLLLVEKICASMCDKIITLTDKCKAEHINLRIAWPEKFVTIHSGIRLERFLSRSFEADRIRAELNIPAGRKIAGTVARLEPVKGIEYLIDSMKDVLSAMSDVHFLIVGDGSQRKYLQRKARELGIEENVTFTGIREDVPRLISIMDLFVLPSLNEGMGRVLVEAGMMAKPVVATNVSGIPELIDHTQTGLLVEPANAKQLAEGIVELLTNPQKARYMGENAKLRMRDNYSADKMVDKIERLYNELLTRKQGRN
jgi:glycosyltransferase involved in cell wall biosynthesis/folate-dependent phosphoribosylglycinamide formyltransferase PurN